MTTPNIQTSSRGALVKTSKNMDIDKSKEHRRADHVNVAYKPTIVDIAHDPLDRIKGEVLFGRVKHRQKYTAHVHDHEHDAGERSEVPPIAEITWCRTIGEFAVDVRENRQAVINPADDWISGGGHGFVFRSRYSAQAAIRRRLSALITAP